MKEVITIILSIIPILAFSQKTVWIYNDYKVLGNDTINRTVNNVKEGNWLNYEVTFNSIACFTSTNCYHQEAIRFIYSQGEFSKGIKIGEWSFYYPSGELNRKEFYSEEGEKVGNFTAYYRNGNVKCKHSWQNNELETQIVYFENGATKYEAKFEGKTIETFKIYYITGELKYLGSNIRDWKIENLRFFTEKKFV